MDWVSTLDQSSRYQMLVDARHDGTDEWLMKSLAFTEWLTCKGTNLWLYGTVGSGKSVQSAMVIEYLQLNCANSSAATKAIAYYYFDANDDDEQIISGFLRSLIVQLSQGLASFPPAVKELYERHSAVRSCNFVKHHELIDTLITILDDQSPISVVLDAIDELPENDIFLLFDILQKLSERAGPRLQFFCTSRPTQQIIREVVGLGWNTASLSTEETDKDISKYVRDCVQSQRAFSHLDASLKEKICSKILQDTQGMFLVAKLQLERLGKVVGKVARAKDILPILESWPQGIFGMYEKMLCDVPDTSQEELRRALLLVCFSKIPVTLAEAAEFAVIKLSSFEATISNRFQNPQALLMSSGSLFVNSESRLYLSHHSIREYLISDHIRAGPAGYFAIDEDSAAEEIFCASLTYLGFLDSHDSEDFNGRVNYERQLSAAKTLNRDYPLANLASLHCIAARPEIRQKYNEGMETILRSKPCLARGFWWLSHHSQSLSPATEPNFENRSSRMARMEIAFLIAHALLNIYATPWMCRLWNSERIVFLPKISCKHTSSSQTNYLNLADASEASSPRSTWVALVILLYEIEYGGEIFESFGSHDEEILISDSNSRSSIFSTNNSYGCMMHLCVSLDVDALSEIIRTKVLKLCEPILEQYHAYRRNMDLLAFAEDSEEIFSGLQLFGDAYQELCCYDLPAVAQTGDWRGRGLMSQFLIFNS